MRILKKDNGSITLFVLIAMLFFGMFLVGMFLINANEEAVGTAQTARIKEIYERGVDNVDEVYETNKPRKPNAGEVVRIENNIKYTADGEGNEVPVPIGFSYIGEGTKETGFVIKNDIDENEFVWIPTDLVEYQTYNWGVGSNDSTKFSEYYTQDVTKNEQIIQDVTDSVSDNNGYYISRYEAGIATKRTDRTETSQDQLPNPVFKATTSDKPIYAYNYINWYDAIYIADNLYNKEEDNVISKLINARGWDTALKFIESIGEDADASYIKNSTNKGWYSNNKDNNSELEVGKSVDITNKTIPNKLKNIYDMGGNVWEWTAGIYRTDSSSNDARRRLFWMGRFCY